MAKKLKSTRPGGNYRSALPTAVVASLAHRVSPYRAPQHDRCDPADAGARRIDAIGVACLDAKPGAGTSSLFPCGACRQVLAEFAGPDLLIHVDGAGTFTLGALLPSPFVIA